MIGGTSLGLTTSEWKAAGLPFEWFLRYAQLDERTQQKVEAHFRDTYPEAVGAKPPRRRS